MKKLFLTAMAFVAMMSAMSFTSCSDDDTNEVVVAQPLEVSN